ncbi:MAG: ABC transporter permease [Rhodobacteraceae bacterium]|jgi:ribose transport system permease protein|nr:ABC transporter permease [Paracoccaceae bacterium]
MTAPRADAPAAGQAGRPGGAEAARLWPIVALASLAVLVIAAMAVTPNFLSVENLRGILRNAAIVGIVAVAMAPVTLSGSFVSLGVTQSAMAAMVGFVVLIGWGWPDWLAVGAVIAGMVAIGMVQGVLVAAGLNPVITTLAAGAILFGTVSELTGGRIVRMGPARPAWGGGEVLGIPLEILVLVLFTGAVTLLMSRSVIGRQTILVGANRATAAVSGISHARVTLVAFAVFSVGLALAGILNAAAFGEAMANSLTGLTFSVIAALLVGGIAIQGGAGSPWQAAAGAVLIAVISNMMVLNDFSPGGRLAVQGAVVVAAVVLIDQVRRRRARG